MDLAPPPSPTLAPLLGFRRGAVVFLLLWVTYAGVHHAEPGWNVNSRFALTRAIVERGSFRVDGIVDQPGRDTYTEDRAFKDGHYYSDKIIGVALLGVPAYAVFRFVTRLTGAPPSLPLGRYVTTIFSVTLCAALIGPAVMNLMLAFGATLAEAFLLMLVLCFGTMVWGYSALFTSYAPALCFSLFAYHRVLRMRLESQWTTAACLRAGAWLGLALLCEYTVGLIAIGLSVYVFFYARPRRAILLWGLGATLPLTVFAVYTILCFGEICIPYKYLDNPTFAQGMGEGLQGVSRFRWPVLYYITLHPYRGLFIMSPVLVFSVLGWGAMFWRGRRFRADALLCAAMGVAYLWFNSSYYMWWGGWTLGPRHLIPALPFAMPPLLWAIRLHRIVAAALAPALVVSIWIVAAPTLVDPQPPHGPYAKQSLLRVEFFHSPLLKSPIFEQSWPAFFSLQTAWHRSTPVKLRGPWYWIGLVLLWGGGLWYLRKREYNRPAAAPTAQPIQG